MQRVEVTTRGGMIALEVEVGDRRVTALLGLDGAAKVRDGLETARKVAKAQRDVGRYDHDETEAEREVRYARMQGLVDSPDY
jgi:hypothetical protein